MICGSGSLSITRTSHSRAAATWNPVERSGQIIATASSVCSLGSGAYTVRHRFGSDWAAAHSLASASSNLSVAACCSSGVSSRSSSAAGTSSCNSWLSTISWHCARAARINPIWVIVSGTCPS